MIDVSRYDEISEYYEIAKTVYVVWKFKNGDSRQLKVDVLHNPATGNYSTRGYWLQDAEISSGHIEDGKKLPPIRTSFWADADLPWTDRKSADEALNQLFSLLSGR